MYRDEHRCKMQDAGILSPESCVLSLESCVLNPVCRTHTPFSTKVFENDNWIPLVYEIRKNGIDVSDMVRK